MQIILGKESAEELRLKHTVLELETFVSAETNNIPITAYCVIKPESVLGEMQDLERLCRLHQTFIDAFNAGRYDSALDAMQHIKGRFSGELDSFYDVIYNKIKVANANNK